MNITVEAAEKVHADELKALKHKSVALEDEGDSFKGKITELQSSVYAKDFDVTVSSLKSQNDDIVDQVHALEAACLVAKLDADLLEMALHLEEKFYPHLLTTISDYLTALGAAISRAIEKGMQSRLAAGIDHDKEGRSLADVFAYNPVVKADYNSALQRLHEVDFLLLAELRSHKDASVVDIMNLLRLEGPLADAPGMSDFYPSVEQLMLHIHRSEDQVVLGETSLSFFLSVAQAQRSALDDVWVPLVEPLSAENLMGAVATTDSVLATILTTPALSTTFASTSLVPPIIIDDYEIVGRAGYYQLILFGWALCLLTLIESAVMLPGLAMPLMYVE
nr:hypothetical protein [Tanacetum cinerariifolium]